MSALPMRCFQNALTAALVPRPGQVGAVLKAGEAAGGASGTFSSKQPCLILFYKKGPYGAVF
jgi:hypothetical protein